MIETRPCVRCGQEPRDGDTFICAGCRHSRRTQSEIRQAQEHSIRLTDQRAWLMTKKHWVGGWSIRRGSVRV